MREVKQPLRQEMAAQGLTVTTLSERLGVIRGAVSGALNPDNNNEAFTLFAMAEALGCAWRVSFCRRENATHEDERAVGA
jgi:transcriptional regulator with XRE-family HTH domain